MSAAARDAASYLPDAEAFEAGAIDPARFDHAAHVHVAWCYLRRWRLPEAIARLAAALEALTGRLGAQAKYHETVSWFFMIVIAERMAASESADWEAFRRANEDLFAGSRALLAGYYSDECLASARARRRFVLPDRVPARRDGGQGLPG